MKVRKTLLSAVAAAGLAGPAVAQAPVPAAAEPLGVAPGPAAPGGPTIWSKLGISKQQKEFCKRKLCKTPLGQLLNNSMAPLTALSGGLIPQFCPVTPSAYELADPGAVGAAAKVKADEAAAKERRAAVRYLGTVDCHYWPEAEDALIGALRGDRVECVRFEAALALGNGCCCTKKVIEALTIVVSCSDRDGAPKETSHRVIAAAQGALARCLSCYVAPPAPAAAPVEPKPETGPTAEPERREARPEVTPAVIPPMSDSGELRPASGLTPLTGRPTGPAYYARIAQQPLAAIVAEGRRVIARQSTATTTAEPLPAGSRSLANVVAYAAGSETGAILPEPPAPARAEDAALRPVNLWDLVNKPSAPPAAAPARIAPPVEPVVVAAEPAMPRPINLWDQVQRPAAKPATASAPVAPAVPEPPVAAVAPPAPVVPAVLTAAPAPEPAPEPVAAAPPSPAARRAVATLMGEGTAGDRRQAADGLSAADLATAPELVRLLLVGSQTDRNDVEVRKACVRALVRCGASSRSVLAALEELSDDPVPAVRAEAIIGLARLRMAAQ